MFITNEMDGDKNNNMDDKKKGQKRESKEEAEGGLYNKQKQILNNN